MKCFSSVAGACVEREGQQLMGRKRVAGIQPVGLEGKRKRQFVLVGFC